MQEEYAAFRGRNRNHAVVAFDKSEYEITSVGADRFCRLGLSKPTNKEVRYDHTGTSKYNRTDVGK